MPGSARAAARTPQATPPADTAQPFTYLHRLLLQPLCCPSCTSQPCLFPGPPTPDAGSAPAQQEASLSARRCPRAPQGLPLLPQGRPSARLASCGSRANHSWRPARLPRLRPAGSSHFHAGERCGGMTVWPQRLHSLLRGPLQSPRTVVLSVWFPRATTSVSTENLLKMQIPGPPDVLKPILWGGGTIRAGTSPSGAAVMQAPENLWLL